MKTKILVLVGSYLPGVKSGGPIRSISNMVESLGDEFDFSIVTPDREIDDRGRTGAPYPGIEANRWTRAGKAEVFYRSPGHRFPELYRILADRRADFLYLNSFFSPGYSIFPLLARNWGARGQREVILAPRGEFCPGALRIRFAKKQAFLTMAKQLSEYKSLIWHASTEFEERDIRTHFPQAVVRTALPLSDFVADPGAPKREPGPLKVVFLARIVPKKNLDFALRVLGERPEQIEFTIVGPVEDSAYWEQCQGEIARLPPNITVKLIPGVPHEQVAGVLSGHHVFLFPTLGENYGHVIFEALSAGCIAIVSDRTPWRDLAATGAGFDLPLERPDLFSSALGKCAALSPAEREVASQAAREFARDFSGRGDSVGATRRLFAPDVRDLQ